MEIFNQHPDYPVVLKICDQLKKQGFQAWLAGGCVRDGLLGRLPRDFDVVTDARPDQVESLFKKTVAVGKQFGIIRVIEDATDIEVATFRTDGLYQDGRHPTSVQFASPQEDAQRRDFTINALFFDPDSHAIHDFVDGRKDLSNKIIRTVGNPGERFTEDRLRILRAIRFISDLGSDFVIEAQTFFEIKAQAKEIVVVSFERQRDELIKLLAGKGRVEAIKLLYSTGLLETLLGFQISKPLAEFMAKTLAAPVTVLAGYALFFGSCEQLFQYDFTQSSSLEIAEQSERFLRKFKFSNHEISTIKTMIQSSYNLQQPVRPAVLMRTASHSWSNDLEAWAHALVHAGISKPKFLLDFQQLLRGNAKLPHPFISGVELKKLGVPTGPIYSQLIEAAYDEQLEGRFSSQNEALNWLKTKLF